MICTPVLQILHTQYMSLQSKNFRNTIKSRIMNHFIHHPAYKTNHQINYLLSYPLIPHHSPNPINHSKHPTAQYPIKYHRPRNGKDLTPNSKHLPLRVCQYRHKKILQKNYNITVLFSIFSLLSDFGYNITIFTFSMSICLQYSIYFSGIPSMLLHEISKHPVLPFSQNSLYFH